MAYEWNDTSRYGALRHFVFDGKDTLSVTCHDVLYTSYTQGMIDGVNKQIGVDPDGGPYMGIKRVIYSMTRKFKILDILSVKDSKRTLRLLLRVEEIV